MPRPRLLIPTADSGEALLSEHGVFSPRSERPHNLCYLLSTAAFAEGFRRMPRWMPGSELENGGTEFGSKPQRSWLLLGIGRQLAAWGDMILRFIPDEAADFTDQDAWNFQRPFLREALGRFFNRAGACPAFVWVSPFWPLPGPKLRPSNVALVDRPRGYTPLAVLGKDTRRLTFGFGSARRSLTVDVRRLLLFYPKDRDRRPELYRTVRDREGVGPDRTIMYSDREHAYCLASPGVDSWSLEHGYIPALTGFMRPGPWGTRGHLAVYNVVLARLSRRGSWHRAWVDQLALTFHAEHGWITNPTASRKDFDFFVERYPSLRELLQQRVLLDESLETLTTPSAEATLLDHGTVRGTDIAEGSVPARQSDLSQVGFSPTVRRTLTEEKTRVAKPPDEGRRLRRPSHKKPSAVDAGTMKITVSSTNDDLTEFVTVFRADGPPLDTDSGEYGSNAHVCFEVGAGAQIFCAVASHEGLSDRLYTITVSQPPARRDNDYPELGESPTGIGGQLTDEGRGFIVGRIETAEDRDWFTIPGLRDGLLLVTDVLDNPLYVCSYTTADFSLALVASACATDIAHTAKGGVMMGKRPRVLLPTDRYASLTSKQRETFELIDQVAGADARTRKQVQALLAGLEGERATEALTAALKHLLQERGWGIRCACGEAAAPLWVRHRRYREGGFMKCTHRARRGNRALREQHGSYTTLPRFRLVRRIDLRRRWKMPLRRPAS